MIKTIFERVLVLSKWFVLLPVVFGIISSGILFVVATEDIIEMIMKLLSDLSHNPEVSLHPYIVSEIIGAVDLYLIAIVLLIFSFGIYELFLSEIRGGAHKIELPAILMISSLDELKDKLAKVIVMVLVVSFFRKVLFIDFRGALEMLYFAISISALSVGVYLLHKDAKHKTIKEE